MRKYSKFRRIAATLLLVAVGCGPSGVPAISSSLGETIVKGTVRVRGKPVDNGSVEFNAANVGRTNVGLRRALINKDGTYTLKIFVGQNSIHVSCRELLTAKNRMFSENEFSLMAGHEENTFDIDIPQGGPEKTGADPPKTKRYPR